MTLTPRSKLLVATLAVVLLAGGAAFFRLRSTVRGALSAPVSSGRPLQFVPIVEERALPAWGDGTVRGAVFTPTGLLTAGGSGVRAVPGRDLSAGLPTLRANAIATWRGDAVVGLEAGGLFRRRAGHWEELRTGHGPLHVRAILETAAGELVVGAREGLFRAAWGGATLERLETHAVRTVVEGASFLLAGGEQGLWRVETSRALRLETPDPWIESVGLLDGEVLAATAAGLARGRLEGRIAAVPGGEDVASGVVHDGRFWGAAAPPVDAVLRFEPGGRLAEERLPALVRQVMTAGGTLLADTDDGLFRRDAAGWRKIADRPEALPPGRAHVGALAFLGGRLVAGFFDGGLATADALGHGWRDVPGSGAWGVNALLPAGGTLYVASLRGAARFDGERLRPLEGPGAAFSLASTRDGVAVGYGQGVLLPGTTLLSAFHGLPGNQALALAGGESLFVGTPSGLGALDGRRVRWRVTSGDGKLPHPWVTALQVAADGLYVGTYGGGLARRTGAVTAGRALADPARYEPFPETAGLKVNPGCVVEAGGRIYAGTDGRGLWRLSRDRSGFEPLRLPLPSPRVTALAAGESALWIGTDEGVARLPLGENE